MRLFIGTWRSTRQSWKSDNADGRDMATPLWEAFASETGGGVCPGSRGWFPPSSFVVLALGATVDLPYLTCHWSLGCSFLPAELIRMPTISSSSTKCGFLRVEKWVMCLDLEGWVSILAVPELWRVLTVFYILEGIKLSAFWINEGLI